MGPGVPKLLIGWVRLTAWASSLAIKTGSTNITVVKLVKPFFIKQK